MLDRAGVRGVRRGALAGLAIAALDLGLVGRRFPRIAALPLLPQLADHAAFGAIAGLCSTRDCLTGEPGIRVATHRGGTMDRERPPMTTDIWTFSEPSVDATSLIGYSVEATDGGIGKIDEATGETGRSHLIVDTGPWIFGKKVLLPAGVVDRVDFDTETVFVSRTKDEIKNAPEFDSDELRDDEAYRGRVGSYYDRG